MRESRMKLEGELYSFFSFSIPISKAPHFGHLDLSQDPKSVLHLKPHFEQTALAYSMEEKTCPKCGSIHT
jgi:hypothetical protein